MRTAYFAANFEQQHFLLNLADSLRRQGLLNCVSRWLNAETKALEKPVEYRVRAALMDEEDICRSDLFVQFCHDGISPRGGREVELGIAIANHIPVWVVGERRNTFQFHPRVENHFPTLHGMLLYLPRWANDNRD